MTAFRIRGAIEGFYGPPWSWQDRDRLVDFLADHGLNTFAYAPKNDPLHRDRWREPYLPEEWEKFARLAARCATAGINFVFGISPLGFRFTDEDFDLLRAKLRAADATGIRHFCLLVDDMPDRVLGNQKSTTPAGPDVALIAGVHATLNEFGAGRHLWFVPQPYSGDTDTAYLRELGERVHPSVEICWTGPQVCSPEVTLEHARQVAASLRRPFVLWDNHPVNDGDMRHDPHLGPLRGRDAHLDDAAAGIVANLALEPEASHIAVATFGDYAADPAAYDPSTSWQRALLAVTGDGSEAGAVALLADLACRSPLEPDRTLENRLTPVLEDFWQTWRVPDDRRRAVEDVGERLAEIAAHADRLEGLGNAHLREDLQPWSGKLARQVTGTRTAVEALRRGLDEPEDPQIPGLRREALDALQAARVTEHWVADDQLDMFARACLHALDAEVLPARAPRPLIVPKPLIVLDDDPTGTQAMADVPVLLRWDDDRLAAILDGGAHSVHLITNSRALPPLQAQRLVADAARMVLRVAPDARIILRGDSTLRGHLLEEYRALQQAAFPKRAPVLLLVPALPPAGRITVGGVHLLARNGQRTPLHDTEYAQDPTFSYRDSRLLSWAEERSAGYFPAHAGREVHLEELRARGPRAVTETLTCLAGASPAVCAPDAETLDDLRRIAAGLKAAQDAGVDVIVRCAPTFAGVLAGSLASGTVALPPARGPVLVVCGSYVPATTRQLSALLAEEPASLVEADVLALAGNDPEQEVERLAAAVTNRLRADGLAVLSTPRTRPAGTDDLDVQTRIADRFAAVLRRVRTPPAMVIAKGGVTSAVTASTGLGATSARVVGPVIDGVGLWQVDVPDGPALAYVVVPGNVGDDDLLVRLVAMARSTNGSQR